MDVNIVFECIGYGATRAVSSAAFPRQGSRVPARFILETAKDPVAYCVEAYLHRYPGRDAEIDTSARAMILTRLRREAGVTTH
jgi:hypothetical protein